MKKLLVMMGLLWGAGALGVWYWNDAHAQRITYRTAPAHRGDLRSTINATGTIEPVEVVEVGAQVGGQIRAFGTDPANPKKPVSYGTHVEVGTVLARLDDTVFRTRLDQARGRVAAANRPTRLSRAEIKLGQAERERDRTARRSCRSRLSGDADRRFRPSMAAAP